MKLSQADKELSALLVAESKRQGQAINLIASENIIWPEALEALASPLTDKYAEGYPGKRYYPGNAIVDKLETLAIKHAKKLFKADHANVQAHSGGVANLAIYSALLNPGDKLMSLGLNDGGHLSHGHPVNQSGKLYRIINYKLGSDGRLDMKAIAATAKVAKPKLIVAGFSAYSRDIDWVAFRKIADSVKACLLADVSHTAGLIAAGLLNSPVPYADVVMFTTHKSLRGPRGAVILCKNNLSQVIDRAIFPGFQGGPHENTVAAIAVALKQASTPTFKTYAKTVIANASALADEFKRLGYKIVSNGTDNHQFVIDLTGQKITGLQAEQTLERANILVSRSAVPGERRSPQDPSGIRLGTYAITSRGMKAKEMKSLAQKIDKILMK